MRRFRSALLLLCVTPLSAIGVVACAGADGASEESATSDEALRTLTASEIIGSLNYGAEAQTTYKRTPYYRAYKFTGTKGDKVVARVSSPSGHDAIAWLVKGNFATMVYNDNAAGGTKDAEVKATLPADGDYYVVFREKTFKVSTLKVKLEGTPEVPVEPDPVTPTNIADADISFYDSLKYGSAKGPFAYSDRDKDFGGLTFKALAGDRLDLDVNGPDATAYLVGPGGSVIKTSADNSLVKFRTTAPTSGDYRIVFHNTYFENQKYNVALNAAPQRDGVDPFDSNSCTGPAMTNQDLVGRLPSPAAAPGETFQLGVHKVMLRTRSCAGPTCGAYSAPVIAAPRTTGDTLLEREQDGSVSLKFRAAGCYSSPEGAKCAIANDGTVNCANYRYTYDRALWNGNYCETKAIDGGNQVVAFKGVLKQHCARATATVRDNNNVEYDYVMLTQF